MVIIILVPNQLIEITISNSNKKHFESLGYECEKLFSKIIVKPEDLIPTSDKKVKVICDHCRKEYLKSWRDHIKTNYVDYCYDCKGYKLKNTLTDKFQSKYYNKIQEIFDKKGYILLTDISDIINRDSKIEFECPLHGKQIQNVTNIIDGNCGCKKCRRIKAANSKKHTLDEVEEIINSYNNNKLLNKEEYDLGKTANLRILCGSCKEHIFTTSLFYYTSNKKQRCDYCSKIMSNNEYKISQFLDSLDIKYTYQKRFNDCKDTKSLPFDFYLDDYNMCIEYDGEQHFIVKTIRNNNIEEAQKEFEEVQKHDQIKNEYCKSHGIELLRIPYWKQDNIEQIITDKLNELDRRYSLVS